MKNFYEFNDVTLINLDEILYIEISLEDYGNRQLKITMKNNKVFIQEAENIDIDSMFTEIKEAILN